MSLDGLIKNNSLDASSEIDDFTEARYLLLSRHLRPETRDVLDIGCNTGRGGAAIKVKLPLLRIVGMDCVSSRLQALDPNVYCGHLEGFAHSVAMPDGSFDAIIAAEVIEHIPPELVFPSLCECFRLLRLHGRLLLTTPNPSSLRRRLRGLTILGDCHVSQHTVASLKRRLEDAGFSRIRSFGSGRVTAILGTRWPNWVYGSYAAIAEKW
jgi:2-polyprenyl-3-methyl-5-hydroxy-6-metoxy-1,4-benzoquinol methylase